MARDMEFRSFSYVQRSRCVAIFCTGSSNLRPVVSRSPRPLSIRARFNLKALDYFPRLVRVSRACAAENSYVTSNALNPRQIILEAKLQMMDFWWNSWSTSPFCGDFRLLGGRETFLLLLNAEPCIICTYFFLSTAC